MLDNVVRALEEAGFDHLMVGDVVPFAAGCGKRTESTSARPPIGT
jgi:hypothetical protein